jgi:branched-chain amino acid transport system permease protein
VGHIISGFMAGVAGALSTQTTKFVGLAVLSLDTSVGALVMLVLGGVGRLYGGLVGAPIYMIVHHIASQWNPITGCSSSAGCWWSWWCSSAAASSA